MTRDKQANGGKTMMWESIETAPRDGSQVLLFYPEKRPGRQIAIGHFVDAEDYLYGKSVRRRQYWSADFFMPMGKDIAPTYWAPLPDAGHLPDGGVHL